MDGGSFVSGTPATFTNLSVGNHNLEVKDANGCTSSLIVVPITQPLLVKANVTGKTNVTCFGFSDGTVTVVGGDGTAPYTYSRDGSPAFVSSGTFTGLSTGLHNITVKDAHGCTATATVSITQPTQLTGSIGSQTNATCTQPTGSVTVFGGGGTSPYSFSLDGVMPYTLGSPGITYSGLTAPVGHTVTVRDANLCTVTISVTITQAAAVNVLLVGQTNVSCNGLSDGTASFTAFGGTGPYFYSMDGGPSTLNTSFTGLAAGTHSVVVTDFSSGCTGSTSVTIIQPAAIGVTISQTNVSCNGGATGSFLVNASGGTPSFTYSKDGGINYQASNAFTNLAAATYSVTVKDSKGCTNTILVTITQAAATTPVVTVVNNCGTSTLSNGYRNFIVEYR